ncbi:MAG: ATP phosphoribosyltransferase regulatory subunit [Firmicutes bacterium]|nr:ATP phosphoribosyltransferase regulatory subunit [Bacillota bacterium]
MTNMNIDPKILRIDERVAHCLRTLYHRFGYCHYKMSKFEEYSLYAKNTDFLGSDAILSFTDTTGRLMALKPDVTLSIISNSKDIPGQVQKVYYDENVYRVPKGTRSYKELKQTGLECMGDIDILEICEVIMLAIRSLENISDDYILELSHVGLIEAIFEEFKITPDLENKVLTCISRKNVDELLLLCKENGICKDKQDKLMVFMKNYSSFNEAVIALESICETISAKEKIEEFSDILDFIQSLGCEKKVKINFALSNDMSYYSGIAFKGYVEGIPSGVLSGGQYDKLMRKMGRKSGAIGFAVYLDALERLNNQENKYDVDIVILYSGNPKAAMKAAETLSYDGTSVRVCRKVPTEIRYRQLITIADEGETDV